MILLLTDLGTPTPDRPGGLDALRAAAHTDYARWVAQGVRYVVLHAPGQHYGALRRDYGGAHLRNGRNDGVRWRTRANWQAFGGQTPTLTDVTDAVPAALDALFECVHPTRWLGRCATEWADGQWRPCALVFDGRGLRVVPTFPQADAGEAGGWPTAWWSRPGSDFRRGPSVPRADPDGAFLVDVARTLEWVEPVIPPFGCMIPGHLRWAARVDRVGWGAWGRRRADGTVTEERRHTRHGIVLLEEAVLRVASTEAAA